MWHIFQIYFDEFFRKRSICSFGLGLGLRSGAQIFFERRCYVSNDISSILVGSKACGKVVKEKGGSLFLFTDSASCPVYSEADEVIRCITNSLLLTNSFAGLISILHVLVQMVYLDEKESAAMSRQNTILMQESGYLVISNPKE